ncbi:MAG: hypothetical protein HY077_15835 [Elusimicrobia bacterium]|nr:hypothetical protein [Elusimicrobiota bacterium]
MLWRRRRAPDEVLEQAGTVAELTRAAARYFREPSEPAAVSARSRARAALDEARTAQAALKGRSDWLAISRSLGELADQTGRAVAQAKLYGVERQQRLARVTLELRETAVALGQALRHAGRTSRCEEHLVEAKRLASSVDEALVRAREASLDDPREVAGLKDREVIRRLGEAAEAAHAAADRLAEVLAVR